MKFYYGWYILATVGMHPIHPDDSGDEVQPMYYIDVMNGCDAFNFVNKISTSDLHAMSLMVTPLTPDQVPMEDYQELLLPKNAEFTTLSGMYFHTELPTDPACHTVINRTAHLIKHIMGYKETAVKFGLISIKETP